MGKKCVHVGLMPSSPQFPWEVDFFFAVFILLLPFFILLFTVCFFGMRLLVSCSWNLIFFNIRTCVDGNSMAFRV